MTKKAWLIPTLFLVGSLLFAACLPGGNGLDWPGRTFDSNGARIFYTATNENGERIRYSGGPAAGGMMGGGLACASCHGPDGRGGERYIHMQTINAPDIRYVALAADEGEGGHEGAETYDLETFRMAVVEGRHPDGERLDSIMPRWQLSDQDLADLLEFLKTLP